MKKLLLAGIIILSVVTIWYYKAHPLGVKMIINGHTVSVELAMTEQEKRKGLSGRGILAPEAGMLFVYPHKDRYGFWMRGMRFPLDFIWIDGNTVVDLSEHVSYPAEVAPKVPVNKVLEVNAGMIQSWNIRIGDTVRFTK